MSGGFGEGERDGRRGFEGRRRIAVGGGVQGFEDLVHERGTQVEVHLIVFDLLIAWTSRSIFTFSRFCG